VLWGRSRVWGRKKQGGRNEEGEEEYEGGKKDNDTNGPSKSRDYNDRTRESERRSWKLESYNLKGKSL